MSDTRVGGAIRYSRDEHSSVTDTRRATYHRMREAGLTKDAARKRADSTADKVHRSLDNPPTPKRPK